MATTFAAKSASNGHRRQHIVELTQTFRSEPEK
jgi:hypothetical protein